MGYSNGKCYAPISPDDVRAVIGENSYDVGTLCMSLKINKWAKFKPLNIDQQHDISLLQRASANHGLTPPKFYINSKTDLVNGLKAGTSGWIYTRPTASCMKRITDFDGYDHNARSPFGSLAGPIDRIILQNTDLVIPASEPIYAEDGSTLVLGDFNNIDYPIKDWYFSILLYNASRYWIASAEHNLSQSGGGDWQVNFGKTINSASYAGKYTAMPFLSSHKWVVGAADPSTFKACAIENNGVVVNLKSASSQYIIEAECYYPTPGSNYLSYSLSIRNNTSTAHTFNTVVLEVASSEAGANPYSLKSFGNITVQANSVWSSGSRPQTVLVPYNGDASTFYRFYGLHYAGQSPKPWIAMMEVEQPEIP